MSNFITDCINGDALMEDVNDYIDEWHNSDSSQPLHDYLGMTQKEYELFVQDENYLGLIITAHKDATDIKLIVQNELAMAARSDDAAKSKLLQDWLEKEGLWE